MRNISYLATIKIKQTKVLLNEKILIEHFEDKKFKIRLIESERKSDKDTEAAFKHYLHNYKNGVSQFYKSDAIAHVKKLFEYKFPSKNLSTLAAEEALQYLNVLQDNLGVSQMGQALRCNLFVCSSQKGFSLQSLTQKAA